MRPTSAAICLEDGYYQLGESFGAETERTGEVVFNTSMSGYQEVLTDPSYARQIVIMTAAHIGNYGVNPEDVESRRIFVEAFAVHDYCAEYSNWRAEKSLGEYLKDSEIPGITGIDTRALTRHIRDKGAMRGVVSAVDLDRDSLTAKALASPSMTGANLVEEVTCRESYSCDEPAGLKYRVVAYDYGMKTNILRMLADKGCAVEVVPASTRAADVLERKPDGVFLSNGPGDPAAVESAIVSVRELLSIVPVFGICLGHQIMALAAGGKTFKLKFGHRGVNQPVKDLATGKIEITSQNHGFAVDEESLKGSGFELTHINLNDRTVEGMRHVEYPAFSVQYHPEASPGPHDAAYLFGRFTKLMDENTAGR